MSVGQNSGQTNIAIDRAAIELAWVTIQFKLAMD